MTELLKFEQGPIRPPNEARSLLLRITRNCPWNRCRFCPVYKRRKFSLRTVEQIKADIQAARDAADHVKALSWKLGFSGRVNDAVISRILSNADYSESLRSVALWMYYGTGACFLQDADNLVMRADDLVEVLTFLKQKFPEITRITTYSRSRTIIRKSVDALTRIREAGLDRVHVGLESGCDEVLKFMQKGVTGDQHVEAGKKIVAAGMELSEYVMPGLGGQEMWRRHAEDTARVLNRINPRFIRLRSLRVPRRVPLYRDLAEGRFTMQSDDQLAREIKVFLENLDGITSTIVSDHIMNLLPEIAGNLPADRQKMLAVVDAYLDLPDEQRLIYRVGRRGGAYESVSDLERDPATYSKIKGLIDEVIQERGKQGLEDFIAELVDRYV